MAAERRGDRPVPAGLRQEAGKSGGILVGSREEALSRLYADRS
jgi:hypothetical protein